MLDTGTGKLLEKEDVWSLLPFTLADRMTSIRVSPSCSRPGYDMGLMSTQIDSKDV